MNGFINLLKPPGMTSSDAVLAVRRLLPKKTAVGHGGTLDPDAAGVLPICVGKATRLFDYIIDKQKVYVGELCLGVTTDTYDLSGRIISAKTVNMDVSRIEEAARTFTGQIMQLPPMYSALKQGGEPLYKKARKGQTAELQPRPVRVDSIEILEQTAENRFLMRIACGKGVYIRSLMHDIGQKLGCGGCMSFLMRERAGAMDVSGALTLDEIVSEPDKSACLLPLDFMLDAYPKAVVAEQYRQNVINGQTIRPAWANLPCEEAGEEAGKTLRLYVGDEFAGMGERTPDGIRINAMLLDR